MKQIILEGNVVSLDGVNRKRIVIDSDANIIKDVTSYDSINNCDSNNPDIYLGDQCLIFPGFIDLHVHAREDVSGKQNYKEDFSSASEAALNGGVVAFADMPNNSCPPIDDESYIAKKNLTLNKNVNNKNVDILLYAGIGPRTKPLSFNVPYKVFMGPSIGELFFDSNSKLEEVISNYSGKNITFHCEDYDILKLNQDKIHHLNKRPVIAEVEAIKFAIYLADKYSLYAKIAHVSTTEGLDLCLKAKQKGAKISIEVSPHHLYFNVENFGFFNENMLQVNPPIRNFSDRNSLLNALKRGEIDYLATDHAPHTLNEKRNGISGIPHLDTYGLFVSWLIKEQNVDPRVIYKMCSYNPGNFFNEFSELKLGRIEQGYSAKFTVLDFSKKTVVDKGYLRTKCKWSPFERVEFPVKTYVLDCLNKERGVK